jgi:hypothetical protein
MTKTTTTRQQLLDALDTMVGDEFTIPSTGEHLQAALREHSDDVIADGFDKVRYRVGDLWVTVAGDAWDYGYATCYCWQGAGHSDDCEASL